MIQPLLALDFGGTKHTAAVIEPGGKDWIAHQRVYSPSGADAQYDITTMITMARNVLDGARPAAIGVSFGGPMDAATSTVRLSNHVPGWENTPLGELLSEKFGAPALVDNDANAAALGEHRFGAGQGYDSLLYITVSTGVGGGWIINGQPWHGADGIAGEIGHTVVDPTGPSCLCGKRGCVERLASGPYMVQDLLQLLRKRPGRGQVLRKMVNGDLEIITSRLISQAAAKGDNLAWEVLKRGAWALGVGIGNAANLINPQRFILGGGVTKSGERFWDVIQRTARQTALPQVQLDIVPATLGDDAPLWGAAALAKSLYYHHDTNQQ